MKLYGTLSQIVAAIFRKDSNNITLRPNQSVTYNADRDVQLPEENANSVLVSKTSPDVLTNKSISGSTNTLSNIPNNATTAASANTPSAIVARDGSGDFSAGTITADLVGNASTATSATSATSFTGSLSGEVTGTQSATVVADDVIDNDNIKSTAAIAYSKLALTGSILNADLAGSIDDTKLNTISTAGKVANSATTATTANTNNTIVARNETGGFSAGGISATSLGVSGNLTTNNFEATGQSLMKFAYINGSTGTGFIEMEGQQVGDVPAPGSGGGEARLFAGEDGKIYVRKKGSSQAEELGAGGSGEVNLVDTPSDAGQWTGVNATVTTNTTAANNPLAGVIDSSISIASSTLNGYAYTRFTMPSALKNRKLKLEWFQIASSLSSGAYKVEVYTNASSDYSGAYTELALSTDSSGTSSIPNLDGKYSTTFDTNGSDYYEIRLVRTAASAATLYVANVVCGPGIQPQGAVVGEWQSYTPTLAGLFTPTSVSFRYRRVGDSLQIEGTGTTGSTTTNEQVRFGLPSGLTVASSYTTATWVGKYMQNAVNSAAYEYTVLANANVSYLTLGEMSVNSGLTAVNSSTGAAYIAANQRFSVKAEVAIAEWAGSGTVNLAQNDVEFAYNTSTSTTASDTTSFGYGPGGALIGSIANALERTVQFQTPIQTGDQLVLEVYDGTTWLDVNKALPFNTSLTYVVQNTKSYGMGIKSSTSTKVVVRFGTYATPSGATYDSAGSAWSGYGAFYWRVRKSSAGAAVGFGIVSGSSAGLLPASNSNLDNATATRLGLKQYVHGTTYNGGIAPTVTLGAGGGTLSSVDLASFVPYQTQDGSWKLKFNISVTVSSAARTLAAVDVVGISVSPLQAVYGLSSSSPLLATSYASNARFQIDHASSTTTKYFFSGEVTLSSKPTWAY